MNTINANDPAMPTLSQSDTHHWDTFAGLTVRQELAARAMQGLLANTLMIDNVSDQSLDWLTKTSVRISDRLIAELNKETP